MKNIRIEKKGDVAILTISRPEALNALNSDVLSQLDAALDSVVADNGIEVLIITGEGRAFVAGADIGEMMNLTAFEGKRFSEKGNAVLLKLENLTIPTIAAVNGYALGGGCELCLACDIRLAGDKAKFGQPEVGLGVTPGFGGTQRLPRIVGVAKATELILTGKTIDAYEAERIRLVTYTYPQEELMDKAMELALAMAAQAQVAVRQAKKCLRRGMQTDIYSGTASESEAFGLCFSTEDQKDAMLAFTEKRKIGAYKNR